MTPAAILSAIQLAVPLVTNLMSYITQATTTLKQSAELTPEQEAALDKSIADLRAAPQPWQIEQPL